MSSAGGGEPKVAKPGAEKRPAVASAEPSHHHHHHHHQQQQHHHHHHSQGTEKRSSIASADSQGLADASESDDDSQYNSEYDSEGSYSSYSDPDETDSDDHQDAKPKPPGNTSGNTSGDKQQEQRDKGNGGDGATARSKTQEHELRSTAAAVRMLGKNQGRDGQSPRQARQEPSAPGNPNSRLFQACRTGSVEETVDALQDGADPEGSRPQDGFRPLHVASIEGHPNVVRVLMRDANAKANRTTAVRADGKNPLLTPLHCAAMGDHRAVVEAILSMATAQGRGTINVDASTSDGSTALHLAIRRGSAAATQALIEKGANINALQGEGLTPLHVACSRTTQAGMFVSMLLEAGADPYIDDAAGRLPLDIAQKQDNNQHTVQLLNEVHTRTATSSPGNGSQSPKAANGSAVQDGLIFREICLYMRAHHLTPRDLFQRLFDQNNTGSVAEKDFAKAVTEYVGLSISGAVVHRLRRSWGVSARSHKMTFTEFENACVQAEEGGGEDTDDDSDEVTIAAGLGNDSSNSKSKETPWSGWHEVVDPVTGRVMFWNARTMETSWERPPGLPSFQEITGTESIAASPMSPKPPPFQEPKPYKPNPMETLARAMHSASTRTPDHSRSVRFPMTPSNAPWENVTDSLTERSANRTVLSGASRSVESESASKTIGSRTMSPMSPTSSTNNYTVQSPLMQPSPPALFPMRRDFGTPKGRSPTPMSPAEERANEEPGSPQPKMRIKSEVKTTLATWCCCWSGIWATTLAQAVSSEPGGKQPSRGAGERRPSSQRKQQYRPHSAQRTARPVGTPSYHAARAAAAIVSTPRAHTPSSHAARAAAAMVTSPGAAKQLGSGGLVNVLRSEYKGVGSATHLHNKSPPFRKSNMTFGTAVARNSTNERENIVAMLLSQGVSEEAAAGLADQIINEAQNRADAGEQKQPPVLNGGDSNNDEEKEGDNGAEGEASAGSHETSNTASKQQIVGDTVEAKPPVPHQSSLRVRIDGPNHLEQSKPISDDGTSSLQNAPPQQSLREWAKLIHSGEWVQSPLTLEGAEGKTKNKRRSSR